MQPIKIRLWAIVATISAVLLLGGVPDTATSQAACTVGTPTAFSYSGSPVATSRPIPTLGEWALLLFSALFASLVWWRERLGRQQPNPS